MASAKDPSPSLSMSAQTVRPTASSRTLSFEKFQPYFSSKRSKYLSRSNPNHADGRSDLSDLSAGTRRCHSLLTQHAPSSELMYDNMAPELRRRSSLRDLSSTPSVSKRSSSCSSTMRNHTDSVKRWAGLTRTVSDWDGLRRDPELWYEDGDCYVHLYARGQSRRGPSFRIPFRAVRQARCGAMFSLCFAQTTKTPGSATSGRQIPSGSSTPISSNSSIELFIPAPENASRENAFQWHLATRNFFAFVLGKPLVGTFLGKSFVDLQERMQLFRSGQIDNREDFLKYAADQGYRDFVDCADYSLAMLYYAEHFKIRDAWIDAFTHSVGMNQSLVLSQEFTQISRLTKALITRAYLEMDIHLGRVSFALRNFLEDDFSPTYLGLTVGARVHLDRFRSFLYSFYVEKFGYWPPPSGSGFSKALYKSLYFDFKHLHDYLVDLDSTTDLMAQKPASGGICVLQNIDLFDKRHSFIPLPHPLPLLPDDPTADNKRTQSQKGLRTLSLGSKQSKTDRYMSARAALNAATNTTDTAVTNSVIVQAYMHFERQGAHNNQREEKVTVADARKIRWMLIYGTLQYLISAVQAPKEVRDTESPEYPLCCLVTERSPWKSATKAPISSHMSSSNIPDAINQHMAQVGRVVPEQFSDQVSGQITIQPDCQTDDYFTHTNPDVTPMATRPVSVEVPAPLRISSGIARNTSGRSLRNLSLSARGSRRNSIIKAAPQPYCEIIVHGFGNGLNPAVVDPPTKASSQVQAPENPTQISDPSLARDFGTATTSRRPSSASGVPVFPRRPPPVEIDCEAIHPTQRTPVVDSFQMDQFVSPILTYQHLDPVRSRDSSNSSTAGESPLWSDEGSCASSKSSNHGEGDSLERKCSSAEVSGLLGGLVSVESSPLSTPGESPSTSANYMSRPRHHDFRFSFYNSDHQAVETPEPTVFSDSSSPVRDPTIGIALAGPSTRGINIQPQVPSSSRSSRKSFQPKTNSRGSVTPSSFEVEASPKPLGMHPPTPPTRTSSLLSSQRGNVLDMISSLSLAPRQHGEQSKTQSKHSKISSHQPSAAAPPPIKTTAPIDMNKVVEKAEKARRKEKRSSFWRF